MSARRYEMGKLVSGAPPEPDIGTPEPIKPNGRISTTADMRTFLLKQMVAVANGSLEPQRAKAICDLAQQVYNSAKLEIEFVKAAAQYEKTPVELTLFAPETEEAE